jgi:sortase B
MKRYDRKKTVAGVSEAGGGFYPPFLHRKHSLIMYMSGIVFLIALVMFFISMYSDWKDNNALQELKQSLIEEKTTALQNETPTETEQPTENVTESEMIAPVMLPEYQVLYEQNEDIIGWLFIEDTMIDYPVMQTPKDETYYLHRDFNKEENKNGCLILDTDTYAGIGCAKQGYVNGEPPSTNLIIHGHTMKSGEMFGGLKKYADYEYGMEHNIICFDSLYEKREYELIAVFYSQVYYQSEDVFKYYKFFQADTQEEFDDWYNNIKELSLYDTGVSAEFGDEFITLSCCAYHVEDGRFVVVGKRIK